ncbi:YHS domain-containing protein [Candidatus Woesearchaeota archaeon]|nr:YHS domain-containing protein [Candidatus Woesearchaeota archaeon]
MATDPICGMEVDEKTAGYSLLKKGKRHYFCSENCYKEFKSR